MIDFNIDEIVELVSKRQGITSRKIIEHFNFTSKNSKSVDNALTRLRGTLSKMKDGPIAFQSYGKIRHWYTTQYAKDNNLAEYLDRNRHSEESILMNHCRLIDSLWRVPSLAL